MPLSITLNEADLERYQLCFGSVALNYNEYLCLLVTIIIFIIGDIEHFKLLFKDL